YRWIRRLLEVDTTGKGARQKGARMIRANIFRMPAAVLQPRAGIAIVLTLVPILAAAEVGPKFYKDDPLTIEPETQDASGMVYRKIDLVYDLGLNQFARPGLPAGSRAENVNTIDEVPDSSWFTNRILTRSLSAEEVMRGAASSGGPVPGPWVVIAA